jgi:hypothetical protein
MSNKLVAVVFNILNKVPEIIDCTTNSIMDYVKL